MDQTNVEVISKLTPPIFVKGLEFFLGMSVLIDASSNTSPKSHNLCVCFLKKELNLSSMSGF